MAIRHRYTREDLDAYFDRVCLQPSKRTYNVSALSDSDKLSFLQLLQKHHLVKVPWENLTQHYSWHRVINVQPSHLFKKIVGTPGVGGYCMEVNYFFHLLLFSLGFDVYMAGSRIFNPDTQRYGGWTHLVNIVNIKGTKYLLDGGMGPNGPDRPLALTPGVAVTQIAPAEMQLDHEPIAQNLDQSQRIWVYKYRWNADKHFQPAYCFTDLEFLPEDVLSMNFAPMLSRQTFFTFRVVAARFTTDKENDDGEGPGSPNEGALDGTIDGTLSLDHNTLRWRRRGDKVLHIEMKDETERLRVLKRYFGITVSEEDRKAILGTSAELHATAVRII